MVQDLICGLWHTSFTVADLERSLAFYRDLLGLEVVVSQEQDNAYTRRLVGMADARLRVAQLRVPGAALGPSGHHLELVEYLAPRDEPLQVRTSRPGAPHLAFVVRDLPTIYRRLLEAGVPFVSPPVAIEAGVNGGGMTVYLRDPDGITLELVQPPPNHSLPGGEGPR